MSNRNDEEFDNYQRSLFREVSEDVEKEQLLQFWKKHGKKAVIATSCVMTIVLSILGYNLYRNWSIETNALLYSDAIAKSLHNPDSAVKTYNELIEEDSDGFALLSRIQKAALMLDEGKEDEGFAELKAIGVDESIPSPFRNLAKTVLAYHLLDKEGKDTEIIELVTPLASEDSLWRGSAREIMALISIKSGDKAKAKELLNQNASDAKLPDSFKVRAREMLSVMN